LTTARKGRAKCLTVGVADNKTFRQLLDGLWRKEKPDR
jgi:hypothetical protein